MTMGCNIHDKLCHLKLNNIDYYVYYHIEFNTNFSTQFGVFSIILRLNLKNNILSIFISSK